MSQSPFFDPDLFNDDDSGDEDSDETLQYGSQAAEVGPHVKPAGDAVVEPHVEGSQKTLVNVSWLEANPIKDIDQDMRQQDMRQMILDFRQVGNRHSGLIAKPAIPAGVSNEGLRGGAKGGGARGGRGGRRPGAGRPAVEMGGAGTCIKEEQFHASFLVTFSVSRELKNEAAVSEMKQEFKLILEVEGEDIEEFCISFERHKTSINFHAYVMYKGPVSSLILLENIGKKQSEVIQVHLRPIRSRSNTLKYITKQDFSPYFNISSSVFHNNYHCYHRLNAKNDLQVGNLGTTQKIFLKMSQQELLSQWSGYKPIQIVPDIPWCKKAIAYVNGMFHAFNNFNERPANMDSRFPKPLLILGKAMYGKTTLLEYILEESGARNYVYRVPNIRCPMYYYDPYFYKIIVIEDIDVKRLNDVSLLPVLKYEQEALVTRDRGLIQCTFRVPVIITANKVVRDIYRELTKTVLADKELKSCKRLVACSEEDETPKVCGVDIRKICNLPLAAPVVAPVNAPLTPLASTNGPEAQNITGGRRTTSTQERQRSASNSVTSMQKSTIHLSSRHSPGRNRKTSINQTPQRERSAAVQTPQRIRERYLARKPERRRTVTPARTYDTRSPLHGERRNEHDRREQERRRRHRRNQNFDTNRKLSESVPYIEAYSSPLSQGNTRSSYNDRRNSTPGPTRSESGTFGSGVTSAQDTVRANGQVSGTASPRLDVTPSPIALARNLSSGQRTTVDPVNGGK